MKYKTVTNNQFMDTLIAYLKELSFNAVIKNQVDADQLETLESIKQADIYLASVDGISTFITYDYDRIPLLQAGIPELYINACMIDREVIPIQYRDQLVKFQRQYVIDNYVELNNYYRILNGLPNIEEDNLLKVTYKGNTNYIHLFDIDTLENMRIDRVIDDLILNNPDKPYLRYLGDKKISLYTARKANRFGLIYLPHIESNFIREKFMNFYEKNRIYTLKTVYSEAYQYMSTLYDNFIGIFILVQTISDMIDDLPDIIVKKEFFDEISIRDMLMSHGVTHFPEIPFRYQLKMVKNLNTLIKYKSSDKNLIDICKLFGFENINIFKYFLLKDRRMFDKDTFAEPDIITDSEGNIISEDKNSEYELKFAKVPMGENPDDYIRNEINHVSYEEVVYNDIFWNGPDSNEEVHEEFKQKILEQEFNYVHSKYLSIDTIYDMSKLSFELTYFFNLIFDQIPNEELLTLRIREINYNRSFRMTDIICMLYILFYERLGIEDTILDTQGKVLHVMGFNFNTNLTEIANYIHEKGYTTDELGLKEFLIPKTPFREYHELINVYLNNKSIYDHLRLMMYKADRYHIYKIYRDIFQALMVSQLNTSIFKDTNGEFAITYTNYIKGRDTVLYKFIKGLDLLDEEEKTSKIIVTIDNIIQSLEEYIKTDDFEFSLSRMSNISSDLIKGYLYKVINFFKSYTVELISLNTLYIIDDKYSNRMNPIDDLNLKTKQIFVTPAKDHTVNPDRVIFGKKCIFKYTDARFIDDCILYPKYY